MIFLTKLVTLILDPLFIDEIKKRRTLKYSRDPLTAGIIKPSQMHELLSTKPSFMSTIVFKQNIAQRKKEDID